MRTCSSSLLLCMCSHGRMPSKQLSQKRSAAQPPHGVTEWAWARLRLCIAGTLNLERPAPAPTAPACPALRSRPWPAHDSMTISGRKVHGHTQCTVHAFVKCMTNMPVKASCMPAQHVLHAELCKDGPGATAPVPVSVATTEPGWSSAAQVSLSARACLAQSAGGGRSARSARARARAPAAAPHRRLHG